MNTLIALMLIAGLLIFATGVYCLLRTMNLIRVIIAIEIAMKAVTLLIAMGGWISGRMDLAQAFIITIIVAEVIVAVVAAGIAVSIFRHNDSLDTHQMHNLKG